MASMMCKAITKRQAEYIGGAAAFVGGYVAVNGPYVERIDRDAYRAIVEDAEDDTVEWRRENARQLAASYHKLPSGDYVRVVSNGSHDDYYLLVVPSDHPLTKYGFELPPSVIRELVPLLEVAGYETTGLLDEPSGEQAEVVKV